MPLCARCLGASIGHILIAVQFFVFQLPSIWFLPVGLSCMLMDWYLQNKRRVYHSNLSRLITGTLGGYAIGILIWKLVELVVQWFF
jgi:uncharacterized membrane protein